MPLKGNRAVGVMLRLRGRRRQVALGVYLEALAKVGKLTTRLEHAELNGWRQTAQARTQALDGSARGQFRSMVIDEMATKAELAEPIALARREADAARENFLEVLRRHKALATLDDKLRRGAAVARAASEAKELDEQFAAYAATQGAGQQLAAVE